MTWLDSCDRMDPAEIGPKAHSLARLLAAGFPVPKGFVLTVAMLRHLATDEALSVPEGSAPSFLGESLEAALAELRHQGVSHVAVRSSAAAEDLANASFAGQYETVLGVPTDRPDTLWDAVRRCCASTLDRHAQAYGASHGLGPADAAMAVLVQTLVNADVAGVAFGVHPVTGDPDSVVINASLGLGESVVSGLVTPDTYVLDGDGTIEHELGDKIVKVIRAEQGLTEVVPTTPKERESQCLTDSQVRAVADLTRRCSVLLGRPADIEFAYEAGSLYLLQSRPVTTGVSDVAS